MNQDLKIIKKKYGEAMMHLCREFFSTILDNHPGELPQILQENFEPSHFLYDDLKFEYYFDEFKTYIYEIYDKRHKPAEPEKCPVASPHELLRQVGYTLYECKCEDDIKAFKKYYAPNEALCTFNGGRLGRCYVYFAVRDHADELNRHDFTKPDRQDEYGTSVISIQFTCDDSHILSIKNRYNHTVENPDATYSNNLDNIVPGLTQSFADYCGMKQSTINDTRDFELPGYVRAKDGKFYKYNYEYDNVYYCPNNIVIDNFQVKHYDKERYLVMDYFILDLVNKKITSKVNDCFPKTIGKIKNIRITKEFYTKDVTITLEEGEDIVITLDEYNCITSYKNNNVLEIADNFLCYNETLEDISLEQVTSIGHWFLFNNRTLEILSLPNVKKIGNYFLEDCQLTELNLPEVETIGCRFLYQNQELTEISLPKVKKIGDDFLLVNSKIYKVDLPKAIEIGIGFLYWNECLQTISLPSVQKISGHFCSRNEKIHTVDLPNVLQIGNKFLYDNQRLTNIDFPKVKSIGDDFLGQNKTVTSVNLPELETLGNDALRINQSVQVFYAPKLESEKIMNEHIKKIWTSSTAKVRRVTR